MKHLAIFKTGRHQATSGEWLNADADWAKSVVAAYDKSKHEAPIVIGHPQDNAPAYGWVESISFDEASGTLYADIAQVEPQFADLLAQGRFKKRSASFYPPNAAGNPTPGQPYLRHVGFLGAQPPAVKGLADFAAQTAPIFEFSETTEENTMDEEELKAKEAELAKAEQALAAREAELKKREEALAAEAAERERAEADDFAEGLVKQGRLLPREKAAVVSVLLSVEKDQSFDFAEGGKTVKENSRAALKTLLGKLPVSVDFAEYGAGDPNQTTKPQMIGDNADESQKMQKIQDFADKHGLTFAQAAAQFEE